MFEGFRSVCSFSWSTIYRPSDSNKNLKVQMTPFLEYIASSGTLKVKRLEIIKLKSSCCHAVSSGKSHLLFKLCFALQILGEMD